MPRVTAVVVTFNRLALLRECLAALAVQTRAPDRVLVVDNASTDGTADAVRAEFPAVELLALPENVGGAGGFHAGMADAHARGADWIWLMDDDTIARPEALAELLAAPERASGLPRPRILASKAVWTDGRLHPMNANGLTKDTPLFLEASGRGLIPLRTATFVSLLVHRDVIDEFGLPLRHYFIWSDDVEYTGRVLRAHHGGYLVPTSVVEHRTKSSYTAVTESEGRFYYHVRNSLWMLRSSAWNVGEKLALVFTVLVTTRLYLTHRRFHRDALAVVARGVRDGLMPAPAD